jgi:hypothetical protein
MIIAFIMNTFVLMMSGFSICNTFPTWRVNLVAMSDNLSDLLPFISFSCSTLII